MTKKLVEALKKINPDMSESAIANIQEIVESAIETRATEKVQKLVEAIDEYIELAADTISESVKDELADELQARGEVVEQEVMESQQEEFNEALEKLTNGVAMYIEHSAETYINENKKQIIDEAVVERANDVIETVGKTFINLGVDLTAIDEAKTATEDSSKLIESALQAKQLAEANARRLQNKLALQESVSDMDLVQRSKLAKIMESEFDSDPDKFQEKLNNMISVITSKSDQTQGGNRTDESFNRLKQPNRRKITY